MRTRSHDTKQTVSLTINSDLCSQAKQLGIDVSQVAEDALAREVVRRLATEIRADLEASNASSEEHGSFADLVRAHYADHE